MWPRVRLVRSDVSEERVASVFRVEEILESLGMDPKEIVTGTLV
jgi:hypothetical protein